MSKKPAARAPIIWIVQYIPQIDEELALPYIDTQRLRDNIQHQRSPATILAGGEEEAFAWNKKRTDLMEALHEEVAERLAERWRHIRLQRARELQSGSAE